MALPDKCAEGQFQFEPDSPEFCESNIQPTTSEFKFSESADIEIKQELIDNTDGEEADGNSPFPFETDQAALKDNKDYQNLIRVLVLLEAQRTTALKDYEYLVQLQDDAMLDPISFVHKLQQKVDLGVPRLQKVTELPNISWEDYSTSLKTVFDSGGPRHLTRRKCKRDMHEVKQENDDTLFRSESSCSSTLTSSMNRVQESETLPCMGEAKPTVSDAKSYIGGTFNQPWSIEEQRQLEALLIKYPPERFESRRWVKIAEELGNRTPQQVASRVQKYFIKLAKLSLPIPGRIPNLAAYGGKGAFHKQRINRFYYPSSTFMASYEPPVFMPEEDGEHSIVYPRNSSMLNPLPSGHFANYEGEDPYSDSDNTPEFSQDYANSDFVTSLPAAYTGRAERKCTLCDCIIVDQCWECVECPPGRVIVCTPCSKQDFIKDGHSSRHLLSRINCRSNQKNFNPD